MELGHERVSLLERSSFQKVALLSMVSGPEDVLQCITCVRCCSIYISICEK